MIKDLFKQRILKSAKKVTKETKIIDFKSKVDVTNKGEWCELIKDIGKYYKNE